LERSKVLEAKIKEIEEDKARVEARSAEMDKTNKDFIKSLDTQITELKKTIKESEAKKEEALSKTTQISLEFNSLRVKFESASSELAYYQKAQDEKVKDILLLKDDVEKEKKSAKEKLQALEEKTKKKEGELSTHIIELKDKLSQQEIEKEELQDQLDAAQIKLKQAQHELSLLENKGNSELEKIKEEYDAQYDLIQKNIKLRDNRITELQEENRVLLEDKKDLNIKIEFLSKKLTKDSSENDDEKIRASELAIQSTVNSLNQEISRLKGELALAKQNSKGSNDLEEEKVQLLIESDNLKTKIKDLEKQVKESKKIAVQAASKETDDLKAEVKECQRKMKMLENELKANNVKNVFLY
jgi:chromosome segregation ATPase